MNKKIFAERLSSARKMSGLSMDELVKKMHGKVSKNAISKYEKGLMLPNSSVAISLSNALSVKVEYFFRESRFEFKNIEFRKKSSKLSKKNQNAIVEKVRDFVERMYELEFLLNERQKFVNPLSKDPVLNLSDVEEKTLELRKKWELGKDPILNVVELLEDVGIMVLELDEDESFDGISAKLNDVYVIAYNKNFDSVRKRFTVLHELAHLVLNFSSKLDEKSKETLCHAFASAFLMPKEVFENEFGKKRNNLTKQELIHLKEHFGASIQAIVYRAFNLNLISSSSKDNFFKAWYRLGYRKKEPGKYKVDESPTKFNQLLQRAVAEEIISLSKSSDLANLSIQELTKKINIIQ